jgi:hypothetical protein
MEATMKPVPKPPAPKLPPDIAGEDLKRLMQAAHEQDLEDAKLPAKFAADDGVRVIEDDAAFED